MVADNRSDRTGESGSDDMALRATGVDTVDYDGPIARVRYPLEEEGEDPLLEVAKGWLQKKKKRARENSKNVTWYEWAAVFVPCVEWMRTYNWKAWLFWDILAGFSVAALEVPQGLSYARNLAGLPSVYGLYGAMVPCWVYAIFGCSKQLAVGPVAVTSLLLNSGILGMPIPYNVDSMKVVAKNCPPDLPITFNEQLGYNVSSGAVWESNLNPDKPCIPELQEMYNHIAIQIAFIAGFLYFGVGVLRLGFLTNFLSHAVITGFTTGAAVIIGSNQIRYFFGMSKCVPQADTLIDSMSQLVDGFDKCSFQWREFLMAMSWLLLLLVFKHVGQKYKRFYFLRTLGPLTVVALALIITNAAGLDEAPANIAVLGKIPEGMPPFTAGWWLPLYYVGPQIKLAILICAVDLMESFSIAKSLALRNNYELTPNREIRGLGLANIAGAMFNCYTTTGSFSRSAVNNDVGAKSPFSEFTTGTLIMFVLLFMTPLLVNLPKNVQGAIIMSAMFSIFNYTEFFYLWKVNKFDWLVFTAGALVTMLAGVEIGIVTALGLALLIVIMKVAFPHTAVLGRIPKTNVYRNIKQYPDAFEYEGIVITRIDAPIYFANVNPIRDALRKYYNRHAKAFGYTPHFVVIDMSPVPEIDATGMHFVKDVLREYVDSDTQLVLANPGARVVEALQRDKLDSEIGREWIFADVHDAVQTCLQAAKEKKVQLEGPHA